MANPLKSLHNGDLQHQRVLLKKREDVLHVADSAVGVKILDELPARLKPFVKTGKLRRKISKT
jgi:hypothetical protein